MSALRATRFRCDECGRVQGGGLAICALCGAVMPLRPILGIVEGLSPPSHIEATDEVQPHDRASDVPLSPSVPKATRNAAIRISLAGVERERIDRVACEWGGADYVLGGGFPLRRVILLGGRRGTGKTTLTLATAAQVASRAGRRVLYCSAEGQSAGELKSMLPQEFSGEQIDVCESNSLITCLAAAVELDPVVVVVDSLQAMRVDGMAKSGDAFAEYALSLLRDLSRSRTCTVVALSQMNAQGAMRGSQLFQQYCDTIAMLERDELGRVRLRIDEKNRGGPIDRIASFVFDDHGALRPAPKEAEQ